MLILVVNLQVHCQIALIIQVQKPGKKHALNKQYALNSELRLLSRVYGMSDSWTLMQTQGALTFCSTLHCCISISVYLPEEDPEWTQTRTWLIEQQHTAWNL